MLLVDCKRINYYQDIHKVLRRMLFEFSIKLADVDWTCPKQIEQVRAEFKHIEQELADHAYHEDAYFHAFIATFLPQVCQHLTKEHQEQELQLQEILHYFEEINLPDTQHVNIGGTIYLLVNRFITSFLQHLDDEETMVMKALWQHCDDETLSQPLTSFLEYMAEKANTSTAT